MKAYQKKVNTNSKMYPTGNTAQLNTQLKFEIKQLIVNFSIL